MKPPAHPQTPPALTWPGKAFIAGLCLLAFGLLLHPVADPDVFIHLRDGRYLMEHGLHVSTEPFAYTVPGKPFETAEWLFRIGLYGAQVLGGFSFLIVLKALAMTLALFWLGILTYRRWPNLGAVAVLMTLAVLSPMTRFFPERPYVFTYLFLPWVLLWLDDYRQAEAAHLTAAGRKLWLIPALVIPWTNLHPAFMVLFGFLGAHLLHDALIYWQHHDAPSRARIRHLGLISLACVLAGAVNPMGFKLYTFSVDMMQSQEFMKYILEWMPPRWPSESVYFILLGLIWLSQLLTLRQAKIYELLPLAAFSYLSLKSYRNIPLLAIAGLPVLAGNSRLLAQRWNLFRPLPTAWKQRGLLFGTLACLGVLTLAGFSGYAFRFGLVPHFYPEEGLAWIERHPFQGRLLTHDIWGGFTGWATHGRIKIFMDGRLPTYGEALYADYRKMIWGTPRCLELLDQYQIEGILVSPKNEPKLFQQLWESHNWALVYWDGTASLYIRRSGINQNWIGPYVYSAVDPKHAPFFNPANPLQALAEIRRAEKETRSFLPYFFEGDLLLRGNDPIAARPALAESLRLYPEHAPTLLDLAIIDRQENHLTDAEARLRKIMTLSPEPSLRGMAAFQLSLVLSEDPKRKSEALRWARQAREDMPNWEPAQDLLNRLQTP